MNLKFYKSATKPSAAAEGSVWFNTTTKRLELITGTSTTDIYGSKISDASYDSSSKKLTITKIDGSSVSVDLSSFASTSDLTNKLNKIQVGGTTVNSTNLNFVSGDNVTITPSNGTITISSTNTDTKVTSVGNHYTPSGGTAKFASSGVLSSITVDAAGHVTAVGSSTGFSADLITSGTIDIARLPAIGTQTTTSSEDSGSNIYTFSDNSTLTVKNGSKGSRGETGLKALQPTKTFSSTYATVEGTASMSFDNFNRTPIVGDTFINMDSAGNMGTWQVTSISGSNATFKLLTVANIKGPKGENGDSATIYTVRSLTTSDIYSTMGNKFSILTTALSTQTPVYIYDELEKIYYRLFAKGTNYFEFENTYNPTKYIRLNYDSKHTALNNIETHKRDVVTSIDNVIGDITLGTGLSISSDGTLNCTVQAGSDYTLPTATDKILGGVKIGENISISSGTIFVPEASKNLGVVKTTSAVTSASGLTACPIVSGVVYYKALTKTSELSNDSGFITSSALTNYVTLSALTSHLTDYAKTSDLPEKLPNPSTLTVQATYKDPETNTTKTKGLFKYDGSSEVAYTFNPENWEFTLEDGSSISKQVFIL